MRIREKNITTTAYIKKIILGIKGLRTHRVKEDNVKTPHNTRYAYKNNYYTTYPIRGYNPVYRPVGGTINKNKYARARGIYYASYNHHHHHQAPLIQPIVKLIMDGRRRKRYFTP